MSTIFKPLTVLLITCVFGSAQASVYKCEKNGEVTFSDQPCSGQMEDISADHAGTVKKKSSVDSSTREFQKKQFLNDLEVSKNKRQIRAKIKDTEDEIEQKQIALQKELLELKTERESLVANDNDDDDELRVMELKKSLSDKMTSLQNQHDREIERLNSRLNGLNEELDNLGR